MMATINYVLDSVDKYNCAFTKNGWKVIFPTIQAQDDDNHEDVRFKKLYASAVKDAEYKLLEEAEYMSKNDYTLGQYHKVVNASFSRATRKLHDYVMGHNQCDDLMFELEVIDQRTIKIS